MKKCWSIILVIALVLLCVVGTSACSSSSKESSGGNQGNVKASKGLEFEKDPDNPYYVVTGIGVCTDKTVYIPEQYDGLPVKAIGKEAFKNCTSFSKIVLPDNIEEIKKEAFYNCTSMTEIELSEGLKSIGNSAFFRCAFSSIRLPSTLQQIGTFAFGAMLCLISLCPKASPRSATVALVDVPAWALLPFLRVSQ